MIAIIDYGMGNLYSVTNALDYLGEKSIITNDAELIKAADGVILPGVGAFPQAIDCLKELKLDKIITDYVKSGKPILGICLGMQLMFEMGYEGQACKGLGLLKGKITKMESKTLKIPHIGWNRLEIVTDNALLNPHEATFVYYVHSYVATDYDEKDLVAYSMYQDLKIPGYFFHDNIMAMQFHPEKSGASGLKMLDNFRRMCR